MTLDELRKFKPQIQALAHEYEGIEHDAIHAALKSLPELRQQLQQIITDHTDDF